MTAEVLRRVTLTCGKGSIVEITERQFQALGDAARLLDDDAKVEVLGSAAEPDTPIPAHVPEAQAPEQVPDAKAETPEQVHAAELETPEQVPDAKAETLKKKSSRKKA